jgi:hypothetical protein
LLVGNFASGSVYETVIGDLMSFGLFAKKVKRQENHWTETCLARTWMRDDAIKNYTQRKR